MLYKQISLAVIVSITIPASVFGQNAACNDFGAQLTSYRNFISKPIHLPKNQSGIQLNLTASSKYLDPSFGKSSFYLDKSNTAWGGNWFACDKGGIAKRWRSTDGKLYADTAELTMQSNQQFWERVRKMTPQQIAELSPVEKFDIYQGNSYFWASNYELKSRGPYRKSRADSNYCGFCNGARAAGVLLPEPIKAITVKSKSGFLQDTNIHVIFYPADLKALAAASCFYLDSINVLNIGVNYDSTFSKDNQCNPNPAVLDIILREYLADYSIPLFLDVMPTNEKWNETILGFDRTISIVPNRNANIKASFIGRVTLVLYCQDEVAIKDINQPTKALMSNKSYATDNKWVKRRNYSYNLYLDANKQIVNGVWTSEPVDYVWLATGEGADHTHYWRQDTETTRDYTGDKNLIFSDILNLIKLSAN